MAIPVLETGWTKQNALTNSLTVTKASGVVSGDLILIIACNEDSTNTAQWDDSTLKPTGFTLIAEGGNSTADAHIAMFWRVADGTEGATFTLPCQSSDYTTAYCLRITGIAASPINANSTPGATSGTSHTVPAVTSSVDDCLVIAGLSFDGADGTSFSTSSTGWTIEDEDATGGGSAGSSSCFASYELASSGTAGALSITSAVSDGAFSFEVAIAGASGGTNTNVALDAASFSLTANSLSLDLGVNLAAESFALTVYDATVSTAANTNVPLDAASFAYTPYDLNLDFTVSLGAASFAWTAYDLDVQKATIVGLDAESFTLTNYDLSLGFSVSLDAASFALTAYDLAIDTAGTTTVQLDAETFNLTPYDLTITLPQPPGRVGGGHGGGTDRIIGDLSVRSWREVAKDKFADEEPSFDNRLPDAIDAAFRDVFGDEEKDALTSGERKRVITATKRRARDIYPEDPLFDLKVKEINQEIDRLIRLWQEISTSERHAHDSMTVLLLSI